MEWAIFSFFSPAFFAPNKSAVGYVLSGLDFVAEHHVIMRREERRIQAG